MMRSGSESRIYPSLRRRSLKRSRRREQREHDPPEYRKPSTLEETDTLLEQYGSRAGLLAGGADLIIKIRNHSLSPDLLSDLRRVPGLQEIRYDEEFGLRIGSLVPVHQLEAPRPGRLSVFRKGITALR